MSEQKYETHMQAATIITAHLLFLFLSQRLFVNLLLLLLLAALVHRERLLVAITIGGGAILERLAAPSDNARK